MASEETPWQIRHSPYGTAEYWDEQAASFDDEPDHGLTSDRVRAAWSRRLDAWLSGLSKLRGRLGVRHRVALCSCG